MAGPDSSWATAEYSGDCSDTFSSPDGRLSAACLDTVEPPQQVIVLRDTSVPQQHGDSPRLHLVGSLWHLQLPAAITRAVGHPAWSADSAWVALTYASRATTGGGGQGLELLVVDTRSFRHGLFSLETKPGGQDGTWGSHLAWAPGREGRPLLAFLSPGRDGQVGSTPGRSVRAAARLPVQPARSCAQAAEAASWCMCRADWPARRGSQGRSAWVHAGAGDAPAHASAPAGHRAAEPALASPGAERAVGTGRLDAGRCAWYRASVAASASASSGHPWCRFRTA